MFVYNILLIFCFYLRPTRAPSACGRPLNTNSPGSRIVGGYSTGFYKYPWYAALMKDGEVNCGGTLVGPRTIITAAHCFKGISSTQSLENIYTVKLGVYNICDTSERTQKEYKVEKVQIHESYQSKDPYYDICIITLRNNTDEYLPSCLPSKIMYDNNRSREAWVQGLGTLKYKGDVPCTLHEARVLLYSDAVCRRMLNSTGNNGSAMQHAICAGYLEGGIDACQGDSGGPLVINNYNGQYTLLGITSYGFGCAEKGVLGVYTDVSHFLDWISEKTKIAPQTTNSSASPLCNTNNTNGTHITQQVVQKPSEIFIISNISITIRNKSSRKARKKIAKKVKHH